jgi:predicted MFS family arabinose efflux permease
MASLALMTQSLAHPYIAHALVAVTGVGTAPPTYTRVVVQWFTRRRGLALGIALSGLGIGSMLLLPAAERTNAMFGWQAAYIGLAAVTLIVSFPVCWFWLHEPPQSAQPATHSSAAIVGSTTTVAAPATPEAEPATRDIDFKEALRGTFFWQLAIGFVLVGVSTSGVMAHLVPILRDAQVSADAISLALAGMGIGFLVGRIASGALLDHFSIRLVVGGCMLLAVVGIGLMLMGAGGIYAVLAAVLLSLAVGAEMDYMAFLIRQYYGIRSYGAIYGFMHGVLVVGSASGPVLMGYGHQFTGSYGQMMWILFIIAIVAVIPFAMLPKAATARHE